MKRYFVLVLIFVLSLLISTTVWAGFHKNKIAVIDFKVLGKGHADAKVCNLKCIQPIRAVG